MTTYPCTTEANVGVKGMPDEDMAILSMHKLRTTPSNVLTAYTCIAELNARANDAPDEIVTLVMWQRLEASSEDTDDALVYNGGQYPDDSTRGAIIDLGNEFEDTSCTKVSLLKYGSRDSR